MEEKHQTSAYGHIVSFAVCHPAGVTEATLKDATLTWTLRTRVGDTAGAWSEGGVA